MHLLEYHKTKLEYLRYYKARIKQVSLVTPVLEEFADPCKVYGDKPITDDLITDIYIDFCNQTRSEESQGYLRTLEG
jgi:hypothetical protein